MGIFPIWFARKGPIGVQGGEAFSSALIPILARGAEGMLLTEGGRFGGYGLHLLKGKPVFLHNLLDLERFRWEAQERLAPGKHHRL